MCNSKYKNFMEGIIMTDERFVRKIIEGVERDFRKSEEQREKELTSLIIPYSKREYERIKRLLKTINEKCKNFTLQLLSKNEIKVYKKKS